MSLLGSLRIRIAFLVLALGVGLTPAVSAVDFITLIDADYSNASGDTTGCTVGTFQGADFELVTTVDTTVDPPVVTGQALNQCVGGVFVPPAGPLACNPFPLADPAPPGWPAPTDAGLDAVEAYVALCIGSIPGSPPVGPQVQLGFLSGSSSAPVDTLFTPSIILDVPQAIVEIPTLGQWGLLLLSLVLFAAGWLTLRRSRSRAALLVGLLLLTSGLGIAVAASPHAADGVLSDWLGHSPAGNDPADAPVNFDIRRVFATIEGGNLFLRIDIDATSAPPPLAVTDAYATAKDTTLNVNAATGVTSNDTLNGGLIVSYGATSGAEQTTIGAATPTSASGSITLNADGSFIYTPLAGFLGSDTFKYILQNAAGSSTATVTLDVGKNTQTISFTSSAPVGAAVGGPTYNVTATATSGLPVTFTIDASASMVCSIAGSTVSFIGVGTCVINANQPGDANYIAAPQVQQSFAVGKGDQTISFTSSVPIGAKVGGPTYNVTATATSGLAVTFTIDASASTVCSIAGSTVSFMGIGTCVINADQPGDANWNAAPQAQQSFAVGKGDQTISFTSSAPASATVNGPTYNVTATATSGLAVTFTIDASASTVCSIAGSTVSFMGIGTCVINADQAGDANWNAAPQAQQSFAVGKGDQTISFTSSAPAGSTVGGPTYNVTATATSGLAVTFTIDASASTVCSIAGSTVSFIGAGTCVINADQAGDANWNAAPQVQQSFAVGKGDQTISFTSSAPVGAQVGGPTYNVTATATSGLAVTFTIDASASTVCSIAGSTVSFIGVGTCVINANQAGDANWNAAPQVQQSFGVGKGDQTISFTSTAPVGAQVGGPTYNVTATATSGLAVTFTIDASASTVCSIAGSTVSFIGVGTCVINANQAGDANWNAAPQVQQSFGVGKGDQTISFTSTAPVGAQVGGPTYNVTATATSGLAVTFTIDASASTVCSIAGSTVSFLAVGTCVINANQAGDANWNAAPQAQQSFAVAKGDQTISFTSSAPVNATVGGPTYNVTATATSGLAVTFTIDASATSVCSIAGSTVSFLTVGTCVIDANQAGDANWNAAPQAQQSFAVAKGDQTISFTSSAPVGAKVGGPSYNVTATATSGLAVTFTIDASASSVCSIVGSTVSFIGAGTCVIDANQAGDANWNAAPQAQQSFAVAKGDQTISFTSSPPIGATVAGPTYTVTATATSGLAVAFTIDASAASVCTIAGSTVSFIGAGTCVINANQLGDANWNAAPQVQQSFSVVKQDQTISFTSTAPVGATVAGPTYTVTATATSGLPVTFTIDGSATSVCTVAGSTVSFIGAGTCVINANQAGNATYNAAPQVQQSFLVVKQDQTMTFTSTPPALATIGGPTYTVTATATSGLAVTFTIDGSATSVCTIAGSTVSFIGGGTCVINANQAGNGTYNAAPQVQQSFAVNFPPQPIASPKENFDTVGNTGFEFKTVPPSFSPGISVSGRLKDNFTDSDGPSPLSVIAIVAGATTNGGTVNVDTNGEFAYTPKAGDTLASDSFTYQITDGAYTINRTVTINLKGRVWYVKNNSAAGGSGRSMDPFDTLNEAELVSLAGDTIYVYFGDGTITGQDAGILLKTNQRLIGEGVQLDVPVIVNGGPNPTVLRAAGSQPLLDRTAAGDCVRVNDTAGVEIRGLSLAGNANAIDITTTGANSGGATIRNNTFRGAGAEGIDVNAGGSGTMTLDIQNNTWNVAGTHTGNAVDLARTAGTMLINFSNNTNILSAATAVNISGGAVASTTITGFSGNSVHQNTVGTGINVTSATFDQTPGGTFQTVSGGTTTVGTTGNGVGGSGVVLTGVAGDLSFSNLEIVADGGAGLRASGTAAYTGSAGFQVTIANTAATKTVTATGGPAVDLTTVSANLPSQTPVATQMTVTSANSPTTGVALNSITGVFSAGSSSSITNITSAAGTAFQVGSSNATVSYAGTITNTNGKGVDLTSNTGSTIGFTGTLTLTSGTNTGFNATGGGTVTATDTASTLSTTTGTALNVVNTTIGAGGLKFRSISANGAASGIVLNTTGSSGSLAVSGTGSAGSGGTIQSTTSHGISLTNTLSPSFNWMSIQSTAASGVNGTQVTNFTFTNGTINNSGTGLGAETSNIAFNTTAAGTENNLSGTVTITGNTLTNSYYHGIDIFNFNGTIADATISNNTITSTNSTATSKGSGIRFIAFGSASTVANVTKATIANNIISNFPSANGIQAQGGNGNAAGPAGVFGTAGSGANIIAITGNRIAGFSAANRIGTQAILAVVNGKGQGNFDVSSNGTLANPLTNTIGTTVALSSLGQAVVTANVTNNIIVANNTAGANGIGAGTSQTFAATDTPNLTVTISNNQVSQTDGNGILVTARDATGTVRAKIQNNTVAAPLSGNRNGIRVDAGNAVSVNDSVCLNISGNTSAGVGLSPEGIGLRKQGTVAATNNFALHGFATSPANQAQTAAYATGQNPGSASGTLIISGDNFNSPTCSFP